MRAWPVPVLGNTKAAFSLWVGWGWGAGLASAQWPVAARPEHPLAPACADPRPVGPLEEPGTEAPEQTPSGARGWQQSPVLLGGG